MSLNYEGSNSKELRPQDASQRHNSLITSVKINNTRYKNLQLIEYVAEFE